MSNLTISTYRGARDFYPEDKARQDWLFEKWSRVAERYGYQSMSAPVLESTDLYLIKGNEEIIKEQTYTFIDRGGRSVTLRPEMTPSAARMVAQQRQELSYPVRWYSIPSLWRYERSQRGRSREFWQFNVEMYGVESIDAEIEILNLVDDVFQAFKAKREFYTIRINSRVLVNHVFVGLGLDATKTEQCIRLVDRIRKMTTAEFAQKLDSITESQTISRAIIGFLASKDVDHLPPELGTLEGAKKLNYLIKVLNRAGITNAVFDPTLMRGFDYYTDIVFEVFDTDPENARSLCGGGRYDELVGRLGVEPVPTIGFAIGDVSFTDFLETHKLLNKLRTTVDATIVIREPEASDIARSVAREMREIGVNVSVDYSNKKLDKQLKNAMKSGVRYIIFVGIDDFQDEIFSIKDMATDKEERHSVSRIVSLIKDGRR